MSESSAENLQRQLDEATAALEAERTEKSTIQSELDAFKSEGLSDADKLQATVKDLTAKLTATTEELTKSKTQGILLRVKTEYPDIPDALLGTGTYEELKSRAESLKTWKTGSNGVGTPPGGAPPQTPKQAVQPDPAQQWAAAGGINPNLDAEAQARAQDEVKKRAEMVTAGDTNGVVADVIKKNATRIMSFFGQTKTPA
jgi:seryl-tRNA synthetase